MGISDTDYMKLLDRVFEAEKYFTGKEYKDIVRRVRQLFDRDGFDLCIKELDKLPSSADLLERLVGKLEGKSVSRTLKKIQRGSGKDNLVAVKGLFSLGTHIMIECEQGNTEYKILVPSIIEKLNEITYNILRG